MRYGPLSLAIGILALVFGLGGSHAERVRIPGSAHVLQWLDVYGLVAAPSPVRAAEWSNASLFVVTDGAAIQWVLLHAWWFAAVAMLLALWAESRRESTLPLSAGFICGALALSVSSFPAAMVSILLGSVAIALLRRKRDPGDASS